MVSVQPTWLPAYLTTTPQPTPPALHMTFFASFEDAVWELLNYFDLPEQAVILLPSFFCGDVITNMQHHQLKTIFYPVNQDFQTNPHTFATLIAKHKPRIVLILHAVGITNTLLKHSKSWLQHLPKNALIIEDSVHRIVVPTRIKLLTQNHIVIDSLRKVVPLPGSRVFMHPTHRRFQPQSNVEKKYRVGVLWWWLQFQLLLHCAQLLPISYFKRKLLQKAEQSMLKGYDLIGDSHWGSAGWKWAKLLSTHIDYAKIESSKHHQVQRYKKLLSELISTKNTLFFQIEFPKNDAKLLRGFPLGIHLHHAHTTLNFLRKNGLLLRFELNDSPWSYNQKVIYLPLGPYLNDNAISTICTLLSQSTKEAQRDLN